MTFTIGAESFPPGRPLHIIGPCSVEGEAQIMQTAALCRELGVPILRGGTFKARTNSSSFQGLGQRGLELLCAAARAHGLLAVTEVLNEEQLEAAMGRVDLIQVGSRSMFNYPLLRAIGRAGVPVILKRGMGATIDEWIAASAYISDEGNRDIILCERGIRTFERATRFTLDVAAIPIASARTGFPVIVDPSHAAGTRALVPPLARAGMAAGASGLIMEVHPTPDEALSDGAQSLDFATCRELMGSLPGPAATSEGSHVPQP